MQEESKKISKSSLIAVIIILISTGVILGQSLPDPDGDGLRNYEELIRGTSPFNTDSDGDGIKDNTEVRKYGTNPTKKDTDDDGLNDKIELVKYGTNPLDPDTDNDYIKDSFDPDPLTYGYYLRFVQDRPTSISEIRLLNMETAEQMEGEIDKLTPKMKSDAKSCISSTKNKTFQNLLELVDNRVPHASNDSDDYPNAKWENQYDDWGSHPRDPLYQYYQAHEEVDLAPDCDDLSAVYDIMADYIIEHENWNTSVNCDMFRFDWDNIAHIACIVNIEGTEYLADPTPGNFTPFSVASNYELTEFREKMLMGKFDKRYFDSKYDSEISFQTDEKLKDNMIELMRSLDSDENLKELYLKGLSITESDFYQRTTLTIDEDGQWRFKI